MIDNINGNEAHIGFHSNQIFLYIYIARKNVNNIIDIDPGVWPFDMKDLTKRDNEKKGK